MWHVLGFFMQVKYEKTNEREIFVQPFFVFNPLILHLLVDKWDIPLVMLLLLLEFALKALNYLFMLHCGLSLWLRTFKLLLGAFADMLQFEDFGSVLLIY